MIIVVYFYIFTSFFKVLCNEVKNKIGWNLSTKGFFLLVLCTRSKLGERCQYYFRKSKQPLFFLYRMELDIFWPTNKKHHDYLYTAARKKKTLISEQPTVDSRFSRQLVYCLRLFYYNNTSTQKSKSIHSLHTIH